MVDLSRHKLLRVMPTAIDVVDTWLGPLREGAAAFQINTDERLAPWLANIAHESRELHDLEERFNYSAARLLQVFPTRVANEAHARELEERGQEAIANFVYASRGGNGPPESGDGWRYRARGPLGITFKNNYRRCSLAITGDAELLVAHPEFLKDPEFGAASAAWYWAAAECNEAADAGDFDGCCDRVNGGRKTLAIGDSNGYASRLEYLKRYA